MANDLNLRDPEHLGFVESKWPDANIGDDLELFESELQDYCALVGNLRRWRRTVPTSLRLSVDLLPAVNLTLDAKVAGQVSRDLANSFRENHFAVFMGMEAGHLEADNLPEEIVVVQPCNYGVAGELYITNICGSEIRDSAHYLGHHPFHFIGNVAQFDEPFDVPVSLEEVSESAEKYTNLEAELKSVFDRLATLKKINDVDDEYTLRPTERAYTETKLVIMDVYEGMGKRFPLPRIVPDGEGGLVADWQRDGRRVRLRFRADRDRRDYIYYQFADDYDVENATIENLTKRLEWLFSP